MAVFDQTKGDDSCLLLTRRRPAEPCGRDRTGSGARAEWRRPTASGRRRCAGRGRGSGHVGAARHSGCGWSRRAGSPRGPMIERRLQSLVAGVTPQDDAGLTAAPGHWSYPGQATQSVIVSPAQGLPSLGEQRSEVDPSEPRHGAEDHYVVLPAALPRLVLLGRNERVAEL